jgi:Fic family protein
LEIEGNTLSEEQITALLENKRVLAPKKDILEVQNAIKVYEQLNKLDPFKLKDIEKLFKFYSIIFL